MRAEDGSWTGISVELWQWIAADLGVDTEFRETAVTGLFDDLAPGRPLDVSIGALTITAEREDRLDFSQPFFLSGLCVAVKTARGPGRLWSWLERVLVWDFWRIVAALFASLLLVAILIWVREHKSNPKEFGGEGKAHRGPVKCVETTSTQAREAMKGMGIPEFVAEILLEQYVAFRERRLDPAEPRTPETTTPTTLAEFARTTLVPAIRARL